MGQWRLWDFLLWSGSCLGCFCTVLPEGRGRRKERQPEVHFIPSQNSESCICNIRGYVRGITSLKDALRKKKQLVADLKCIDLSQLSSPSYEPSFCPGPQRLGFDSPEPLIHAYGSNISWTQKQDMDWQLYLQGQKDRICEIRAIPGNLGRMVSIATYYLSKGPDTGGS